MNTGMVLPGVDVDDVSRPFFEAAAEGRLLVQCCSACQTAQLGSEICNHCFGTRLEWVAASGKAVIHSFVVMHIGYHPAFQPPYRAAMVELEEGPRLPVYLDDGVPPRIGQAVVVQFAPTENATLVPVARGA